MGGMVGRGPRADVARWADAVRTWTGIVALLAGAAAACSSPEPETVGSCTIEPDTDCRSDLLDEADLAEADLAGADLRDASLRDADLRDANLRDADLAGAILARADLRGADLRGADLAEAQLAEADLRDATLGATDLTDAQLSQADLAGANLRDANLSRTVLSDADLAGTDLAGAMLTGTWLNGTDLAETRLGEVDPAAFSPVLDGASGLDDRRLAAALDVREPELARALAERQLQLEPVEQIQAAVAPACGHVAVPDAGTADTGDFRPLVADPMSIVGVDLANDLPAYQPAALRFARLVLCDDFTTQEIGQCGPYQPGPGMVPVVQERLVVRIVEARTAAEVAARTFEGSPDYQCPGLITSESCDLATGVGCGSWPDIQQQVDMAAVRQFVDSVTTVR